MGFRARSLAGFAAAIFVIWFSGLLTGCGGSSASTASTTPGGSSSGSGSGGTGSSNSGSGGSNSGGSSSAVAYAYTSNVTSIFGYAVNADGSLTTVPGSPNAVSTQVGESGQGALVTNGANLYAIASGGTNLLIMPIDKSNGALSQPSSSSAITGDPSTSDMAQSLSLDATGGSLYVQAGLSDLDSGINVFAVGSIASVRQVQFVTTGAITQSALVFTADNQFAYTDACAARESGVFGFRRAADGTLTEFQVPQVTPPASSPGTVFCPIAIAASATGHLAIAWTPFQFPSSVTVGNQTFVGIYNVGSDGTLSLIPNSGVTTASTSKDTVAINFDPTGNFLAVAGNGGVQTYALTSGGILTPVTAPQDAGVRFAYVAWDKSNHAFATSSNQLYIFNSNQGTLTLAPGSPHSGGPGLAVLPLK